MQLNLNNFPSKLKLYNKTADMKSTDRLSTYIPMSPLNTFFYVFTPSRIAGCRKSYSKINHSFPSPILIENQPEIIERDEDWLCVISNAYKEILNLILR